MENIVNKTEDIEIIPISKQEIFNPKNTTKGIEKVNTISDKVEQIVWYNEKELKMFFMSIPQDRMRDKVFFLSLLGTGKRVSELLSVKKNEIDFTNRTMKIVSLKKRKKKIEVIRLHQDIAYWLSIYTSNLNANDLIFSFTRQYADDLCKKYAKMAGLTYKRSSCHNFRHTFAVRWLEQGKPIHKLKRHLNHAHITTTMKYLQIVDSDYFETVDGLDMLGFLKY